MKFVAICLSAILSTGLLQAQTKVLALSGSLQENSTNKKLVVEASKLAESLGAQVTVISLKDFNMPFYDADLEAREGMPQKAKELRQKMIDSQVIFIASPEYNGSVSGVLKNAIDWASRSEDKNASRSAFQGKKFVLMSTSPGPTGGARGLAHLRAVVENIGGTVLPLQITVANGYEAFDEQGRLKDTQKRQELQKAVSQSLQ